MERRGEIALLYSIGIFSPLKCRFQLSSQYHLRCAIQTTNVDSLGGSDGIPTTGTDILTGGTGLCHHWWRGRGVCAAACASVGEKLVTVDQNVGQFVVHAELQQTVAGGSDGPAVLIMMGYD